MSQKIALATIAMHNMPGGLEKNITYLANHLAENGHEVTLMTFDLPGAQAFYKLDEKITWVCLGNSQPHRKITLFERLCLINRMRRTLKEQGIEKMVCFHHGILIRFLLASLFLGLYIICSERNALSLYKFTRAKKWNVHFLAMFFVDRITVQFSDYKNDYPALMRPKINYVHNPVYPLQTEEIPQRSNIILSIGRLGHQKNFEGLIKAFKIFHKNQPNWQLKIVGSGEEQTNLEALIASLNLRNHIQIIAPTNNLAPYFEEARFYCQSSLWEGFPNAQAEAMSAGCIPIGFKASKGVSNLIEDEINGYLADDEFAPSSLAKTLIKAAENSQKWPKISAEARKVSIRYSHQSWTQCWSKILSH